MINGVFFGLITAAVIALVTFVIVSSVRFMDTLKAVRRFLDTADVTLKETMQTIGEANQNLRNLRRITEDVSAVTDDIRSFSGSMRDVGYGVKQLTTNVRQIGEQIENLGAETFASVCGLRAGVKTGIEVFLKNLLR
ncbi:MAG: DUF948 domain-containing protein [Syntrophorhabdales bacterium]|jgi:uncharacterized protein YoxC